MIVARERVKSRYNQGFRDGLRGVKPRMPLHPEYMRGWHTGSNRRDQTAGRD